MALRAILFRSKKHTGTSAADVISQQSTAVRGPVMLLLTVTPSAESTNTTDDYLFETKI
jgi:hypothetical protein